MRIWVVNPFDPIPGDTFRAGRYTCICDQLAKRGHEVTWWSSNFFHTLKETRGIGWTERWPLENFRVVLLPTPVYRRNVSLRRVYSHLMFARQFVRAGRQENRPHVILASFPPIESSFCATRRWAGSGTRIVIDVQDIWPDSFELLFPKWFRGLAHVFLGGHRQAVNSMFARADAIMGVSDTWVQYGLKRVFRSVPSLMVPIGVDVQAFDQAGGTLGVVGSKRERSAIFVGTVGRGYDLHTVVEAAAIARSRGDSLIFHIAGDGPDLPRLRRLAERKGLRNVVFHGLLAFSEMIALLSKSMVGLNAISQGTMAPLGNKLFDYLAAGLPVLNSSPGEAADLLEREEIGLTYPASDAAALYEGVATLLADAGRWSRMSARARWLAVERYDRRKIYPQIVPFLDQVCAGQVA